MNWQRVRNYLTNIPYQIDTGLIFIFMTPIQILNQHFQGKSIYGYTPMMDGEILTGKHSMTIFKSNIISGVEYRVKRYTIKRVEMPTWKDWQECTDPFWLVLDNGKRFPIRMDCKLETL